MEIQKLLMLLAASWMCCDASDQKSELLHRLLSGYEKDLKPPLLRGFNTTVNVGLTLLCATPVGDFVSIESWIWIVSGVVTYTQFYPTTECTVQMQQMFTELYP